MNMSAEEARTIVETLLGKAALNKTPAEIEAALRETDWYKDRLKIVEDFWQKNPLDGTGLFDLTSAQLDAAYKEALRRART